MNKVQKILFKKKKIIKKKHCVLCFSKNINKVLDFSKTPLANSYKKDLKVKESYLNYLVFYVKIVGIFN